MYSHRARQQTPQKESQVSSTTSIYLAYNNPNLKEYSSEEYGEHSSKKTELVVVSKQCYANDGYESVTNSDNTVASFSIPRKMPTVEHSLVQLHELDELLAFSQEVFTGQQCYLAQRIQELLDLCAEDEEVTVSADSLKSMLLFLMKLQKINLVDMTVSEEGLFHLQWKKANFHVATLRFKPSYLDYVVFLPSQESNHPIVLNGKMGVFDFYQVFIEQPSAIRDLISGN